MKFILSIWLGDNVPEYTAIFCVWILMVKLVDSLNPPCTNIIMASGQIKLYMIVSSILIFSVVPISILTFKVYENPVLMFSIMLICTLVNQVASILILHKVIDTISLRKYMLEIVVPAILLFAVSNIVIYFRHSLVCFKPFVSLLIDFIISLICTIVMSLFLLNKSEKHFVLNSIKR